MNTYLCKGYAHKSDAKPLIKHTCQAISANQAKTLFSAYVSEKRVQAPVRVIRKVGSATAATTDLPVNGATGTINPF